MKAWNRKRKPKGWTKPKWSKKNILNLKYQTLYSRNMRKRGIFSGMPFSGLLNYNTKLVRNNN